MSESSYSRTRDLGLLVIRIGLGAAFLVHGWPKIIGGPKYWETMGHNAGVTTPAVATVAGCIGAVIEFGGGLLLIAGLAFRPVCILLFLQMAVALFLVHLRQGQHFDMYSHALEDGVMFLGLALVGPGKFSADARL